MYLPSLPGIARDLHATSAEVQLSVTAFLTGFCLGMLLYGPLADRFGRRPVLITGIFFYVITSVLCAFAQNVEQLVALRLLQALGGGAASVLGRAIVRDVFPPLDAARVLSIMHVITMIAPLVAPILGGYLLIGFGWRSIFTVLAGFGLICLAPVLWRLKETYPPTQRTATNLRSAFVPYGHLLRNRRALGYVLCGGLSFAGMFAFIAGSPFVYIEYFRVAPDHYGYLFGLNIVGIMLATTYNAKKVKRVGSQTMLSVGAAVAAVSGMVLAVSGITGFGGLAGVVIPLFFFVAVTGLIGANCVAQLLALFPQSAGVAAATFGAAQFGLGAAASVAVGVFHNGTPTAMCLVVAVTGCGSLMLLQLTRTKTRSVSDPG